MKLVAIDIIGTIRWFVRWALKEALLLLGIILFGLSAPLLFTVGIEILVWQGADMSTWAPAYFLLGPFACAIWMVLICHWHSVRQWQRQGKDLGIMGSNWREAHGGVVCTVGKSVWFMVSGFFGSGIAEGIFIIAAYLLFRHDPTRESVMIYFAIAPLFVFAPVLLVLLSRWIRRGDYAIA
jgi:hypothetical protein